MSEKNVLTESVKLWPGKKPVTELMSYVNDLCGTNYKLTYFYKWLGGKALMPQTVERVLRHYVIRRTFTEAKATALLEIIERPKLEGEK